MSTHWNRREFLAGAAAAALMAQAAAEDAQSGLAFETTDSTLQNCYRSALDLLRGNILTMPGYRKPLLIEGSTYRGVWLECAPQEGLVYARIRPDVARNNHTAFFDLQRDDGQLPCNVKTTEVGHGQIQMVVPIAATAWELAQQTGDERLIRQAYASCSRWDAWLDRYRNARGTGLCEGFCTYDTGHDNSPRWAGIPNQCPHADARLCPPLPSMPRLCPDLSATVYGGRLALAAMAQALGKPAEAERWRQRAEDIRTLILTRLYDAEDAAFYDLDAQNRFVRVRGDVISRVLGEHVVDQPLFETIYHRQIHNPGSFWALYPLPSIALDDPHFVRPIPRNSWGGASQALTALRAPRWMEHYGKPAALAHLMQQWVAALERAGDFRQQMDPLTGQFTPDRGGYSPAALVLLDFTWRLAGVRQLGDKLEWNVRPPAAGVHSSFRLRLRPTLVAELRYEQGAATLLLNEKVIGRVQGTVRLVGTAEGKLESAAGIAEQPSQVHLETAAGKRSEFRIEPNAGVELQL